MGISENFLVNTKSFDPIIQALISRSEQPDTISDTTLEKMGYDNPSDLLVLHVLRGLGIINQDKTPSDLYHKMVDPDHTKEAIAEGVINGYRDLFLENPDIHKMLPGEIQEELKDYFDGKKTDLIVKYIANTFHKLVSYAGIQAVEEARDRILGDEMVTAKSEADSDDNVEIGVEVETEDEASDSADIESTVKETGSNGKPKPDYRAASEQNEISSRSVEEILFGDKRADEDTKESLENSDETAEEETAAEQREPQSTADSDEDDNDAISLTETETTEDGDDETSEVNVHDEHPSQDEQAGAPESPSLSEKGEFSLSRLDTTDKRIQKAVVRRSELQYKLGHHEDALDSSEEIIAYFDNADEPLLSQAVSDAVIRRVELVKKLDQEHKLLPALNDVIRRFSSSDNPEYYEQASKAMLQKAELLEAKDFDRKDLLPLYNNIIRRLEDESDPYIQEKVNEIFIRRLKLLNRADDKSELLKALDESIRRFGDTKRFRKYLEETMFRKAEILEDMNRNEEALEAYTSFLEEFGQPVGS